MTRLLKLATAVCVWFVSTCIGLTAIEWGARSLVTRDQWDSFVDSLYHQADQLKIYNRMYYEHHQEQFQGWPFRPQFFEAKTPTPWYVFKPNVRMAMRNWQLIPPQPEEPIYWSTNRLGLRGPDVSPVKVPGTIRIICLGASTTNSWTFRLEETYPFLLGEELRRQLPTQQFEVINAGFEGHRVADSLAILTQLVLPLQPDIVIYYEANNSVNVNEFLDGLPCHVGMPFGMRADCWRVLAPYPRFVRRSALFGLLSNRFPPPAIPHAFNDGPGKSPVLAYKRVLKEMVRETQARKSVMVLSSFITLAQSELTVSYSNHARLFVDLYKDLYPLTTGEIARIYRRFNEQSLAAASELGAPYADVASAFPHEPRYFPFDVIHLNAEGNRVLAKLFADFLLHKVLPSIQRGAAQVD